MTAADKIAEALLPCPFCGGKAVLVEGEECAYVQCLAMKMHRSMFVDGDNNAAAEALEQWNRRTDLADALAQENAKLRQMLESTVCYGCDQRIGDKQSRGFVCISCKPKREFLASTTLGDTP